MLLRFKLRKKEVVKISNEKNIGFVFWLPYLFSFSDINLKPTGFLNDEELKRKIKNVGPASIYPDLKQFKGDEKFVKNLSKHIKEI